MHALIICHLLAFPSVPHLAISAQPFASPEAASTAPVSLLMPGPGENLYYLEAGRRVRSPDQLPSNRYKAELTTYSALHR